MTIKQWQNFKVNVKTIAVHCSPHYNWHVQGDIYRRNAAVSAMPYVSTLQCTIICYDKMLLYISLFDFKM